MPPELSPELTEALRASGDKPLSVIDPATNHLYVVVDQQTHELAMEALRQREAECGIRDGLADMHAGRSMPIEDARKLTEQKFQTQQR